MLGPTKLTKNSSAPQSHDMIVPFPQITPPPPSLLGMSGLTRVKVNDNVPTFPLSHLPKMLIHEGGNRGPIGAHDEGGVLERLKTQDVACKMMLVCEFSFDRHDEEIVVTPDQADACSLGYYWRVQPLC
ncbi:unnamed protein product [Protopolystoma xenopodis]|uniref:Uncharacterized protein n=1 Tax=Protopolystoma xenopodis TaxID=117903 RepID=A0A448WPM7_9PLAT|nr:unnamed protein product [Protopolystoma xenopodis]